VASSYPGSLDSFDTIASDKKTSDAVGGRTHRQMHNDLGDAIEAVQAELGTDPAGAYATVKARFEAIEGSTLPQIDAKGDLVVGTADNTYDNLTVGANNTVLVADSAQSKGVKWGTTVGVWTVAGLHVGYAAKTSAYTATTSDDVLNVTSGTFTLDLPAANTCTGKTLKVKNSGTGVVTLDGNSAETVEGVATFPLGNGSYVEITSTGSAWILTGGVPDTGTRLVAVDGSGWSGNVHLRRVGSVVEVKPDTSRLTMPAAGTDTVMTLPSGFRAIGNGFTEGISFNHTSNAVFPMLMSSGGAIYYYATSGRSAGNTLSFTLTFTTANAWPTSLPGSAA
jgi:hypothetical protein